MAHVFSLFPNAKPGYVDGRRQTETGTTKFPNTSFFRGPLKPNRIEADIFELETSGEIPRSIDGVFFRVQPDSQFPPVFEDDVHFSGDGRVSAFRFQDGHVDWKQRYVRTDRFRAERAARRALFGRYRNPFTDNEMVKGVIRTVSNTNVIFWRGVLLAMKEDGPPFAMDPVTLETIGRYDFEGQVDSPTFTAHPKFDPVMGEMVAFAYAASDDGQHASRDIIVWTFDAQTGEKKREHTYKAPFCGMIHDAALTEHYLVLPLTPLKASLERLRKGGNHWAWDPEEDQLYGIVSRKGDKDIIWLRSNNAFHGHVAGAYEDDKGHIVCDLTVADGNVFYWWPPENSSSGPNTRQKLNADTHRWIFDPDSKSGTCVVPAELYGTNGEFSRIDERFVAKKYRHFWQLQIDSSRPYDMAKCGPPAGGLFNVIGHYDWDAPLNQDGTRFKDEYWAGPTCTFQEPVFVPRSHDAAEGEGYVMALVNHLDVLRNDIFIFDALDLAKGPIGACHLPLHIGIGLHGNFVDEADMACWRSAREANGDIAPARPASEPLPWQRELIVQNCCKRESSR
ncbi:uncharacterized protein PpBr36_06146 [Pyricularia pennisetigena]|uniref:uncharacterized protein n=1 Tax=Pyricularia pennisetigena TaxID=1578925 RepID=UPI0011542635|nr:uncharacterized protein PpBr36_06146 [Pyricularia pennisetigena]TLS22845.1 hypothetical protein PpBr36_06146 [Pyricularia pennisetigena]